MAQLILNPHYDISEETESVEQEYLFLSRAMDFLVQNRILRYQKDPATLDVSLLPMSKKQDERIKDILEADRPKKEYCLNVKVSRDVGGISVVTLNEEKIPTSEITVNTSDLVESVSFGYSQNEHFLEFIVKNFPLPAEGSNLRYRLRFNYRG